MNKKSEHLNFLSSPYFIFLPSNLEFFLLNFQGLNKSKESKLFEQESLNEA